jgi:LuxR family transcriptional regulator, quorum-sensing system regulator SdiA
MNIINMKAALKPAPAITGLFEPCDDEETLWTKLTQFVDSRYGIKSVLFAFTHSKYTASRTGIVPSLFMRHNHDPDYMALFPNGFSLEDDIAADLLMQGVGPLLWSDFPAMNMRESHRNRFAFDQQHGMGVGVSFPFRFGGNSGIGGMCWAARTRDERAFAEVWRKNRAEMEQVANLFDRHMRPAMIRNRIKLTPRERDVLSYSAGGMTAKQIAAHLGLKTKTISNTLERARHAMGAVSTLEAVAKALVYDLIG